jgi:predicted AlkP superfamily phosphohydrolase/phosphomutase
MNKVLLLGLDAMDPKVTRKLIEEDRLPNFESLEFNELPSSYPPHTPVAWTSIATGKNPGEHNIFDFIKRDPKTYTPQLALFDTVGGVSGTKYQSNIRAEPFWSKLSEKGIKTTIIRYPMTFPPTKLNGNLLSGLGVPDLKGYLSSYTIYTTKDIRDKKVVNVAVDGSKIQTNLFGPKTMKGGGIVDITTPMSIEIKDDSVVLSVEKESYEVKEKDWSDWIRVEFKAGMFSKMSGICRAYLISLDPFEMYLTTIQIDPEVPLTDISYPKEYSKDLAKENGLYYTLGMPEETDPYVDGRITGDVFLQQCAQIEEQRDKMFWHEFSKFDEGLFAFVYDTSDRIQHVFWSNNFLEGEELTVSPEIEKYWVEKDKLLGDILGKIDKETKLMILSDHGFNSFERAVSINRWLVDEGFMKLTKEIGNDEAPLFEFVDWPKTQAYSLGFNSLYINVKGREGGGIVEDRKSTAREIISKLEKLKDDKFGKNAVHKAYLREDIYSGPYVKNAPVIIIGFNNG